MKNLITFIIVVAFIAGLFTMVEIAFLLVPALGVIAMLGMLIYLLVIAARAVNDDMPKL